MDQMERCHRYPMRGPVALDLHFRAAQRNPPSIHRVVKHTLDLLGPALPGIKRPRRRSVLYRDDRQVKFLYADLDQEWSHKDSDGTSTGGLFIVARRASDVAADLCIAARLHRHCWEDEDDTVPPGPTGGEAASRAGTAHPLELVATRKQLPAHGDRSGRSGPPAGRQHVEKRLRPALKVADARSAGDRDDDDGLVLAPMAGDHLGVNHLRVACRSMLVVGAGRGPAPVVSGRCWAERLLYLPAVLAVRLLTFKRQPIESSASERTPCVPQSPRRKTPPFPHHGVAQRLPQGEVAWRDRRPPLPRRPRVDPVPASSRS
jgi:hypothetical protein